MQFGKYDWIVEADIKGFFDNIDHDWMIRMLENRINDKPFLRLIRKWLKAGIMDVSGKVIHPATGTPQGGIWTGFQELLTQHLIPVPKVTEKYLDRQLKLFV